MFQAPNPEWLFIYLHERYFLLVVYLIEYGSKASWKSLYCFIYLYLRFTQLHTSLVLEVSLTFDLTGPILRNKKIKKKRWQMIHIWDTHKSVFAEFVNVQVGNNNPWFYNTGSVRLLKRYRIFHQLRRWSDRLFSTYRAAKSAPKSSAFTQHLISYSPWSELASPSRKTTSNPLQERFTITEETWIPEGDSTPGGGATPRGRGHPGGRLHPPSTPPPPRGAEEGGESLGGALKTRDKHVNGW